MQPPDARRVAARATVLAAVVCRALIETDPDRQGAEDVRQQILPWLDSIGLTPELEPHETALISAPIGNLDAKTQNDASWNAEALVVLAWALQKAPLPDPHAECDPHALAAAIGLFSDLDNVALWPPPLRSADEIRAQSETYSDLQRHPSGDRHLLSIAQERYQAFQWLLTATFPRTP